MYRLSSYAVDPVSAQLALMNVLLAAHLFLRLVERLRGPRK